MQAGMEPRSLESQSPPGELAQNGEEDSNIRDEERAFARRERPSSISLRSAFRNSEDTNVEETELRTRASSIHSSTAYIRRQTARLLEAIKPSQHRADGPVPPKLLELINAFKHSEIQQALTSEILSAARIDGCVNPQLGHGRTQEGGLLPQGLDQHCLPTRKDTQDNPGVTWSRAKIDQGSRRSGRDCRRCECRINDVQLQDIACFSDPCEVELLVGVQNQCRVY